MEKIPKVIHYCWFGRGKKTKKMENCIHSWKKYFPNYQIVEWNENNYKIEQKPLYVQQAYQAKKWAFVSDYARFDILYQNGGIYFDTDVEVIRSMSSIIEKGGFFGCECDPSTDGMVKISVASGLGMAAPKGHSIYKEMLDLYSLDSFLDKENKLNLTTVVERLTMILKQHGLREVNEIQNICNIYIYPTCFFCPPLNWRVKLFHKYKNAYSIHWYNASWVDEKTKRNMRKEIWINRVKKLLKIILGNF